MTPETHALMLRYLDEFQTYPDVTTIAIGEGNDALFVKKLQEALDRGTRLTSAEEKEIENELTRGVPKGAFI